ncbi:DUF2795 domain-containing protein [Humibacter sp.]|jgi:hypothetical protein|uniref:DUF2795 domain-containing protein n=1 Tax=Humibacter sp. TaxID=1940291 RepID=UPI002CDB917D|nr:DUF2795 domain-containing protein [Humibacter sp.]HVX08998.1 DUF2795 domain-containing protein [Humibacter sp.]
MSVALESVLTDMEYPATRDDLVRVAVISGCDPQSVGDLRALPAVSFHGVYEVRRALAAAARRASTVPGGPGRAPILLPSAS